MFPTVLQVLTLLQTLIVAKTIRINVGKDDELAFDPDYVSAASGDVVEFYFYPGLHGVAQSTFDRPCVPAGDFAIFSGFIEPSSDTGEALFSYFVNATDPLWLYCPHDDHCSKGMSMVVNANSPDDFGLYHNASRGITGKAPSQIQGGFVVSSAEAFSSIPVTSSIPPATSSPLASGMPGVPIASPPPSNGDVPPSRGTTVPPATNNGPQNESDPNGDSGQGISGAAIGGIVAAVVVLLAAGIILWLLKRRRQRRRGESVTPTIGKPGLGEKGNQTTSTASASASASASEPPYYLPREGVEELSAPHGRSEMRASRSVVGSEPLNGVAERPVPHGRGEMRVSPSVVGSQPHGGTEERSVPFGRSEMLVSPSAVGSQPLNGAGQLSSPHGRSEMRASPSAVRSEPLNGIGELSVPHGRSEMRATSSVAGSEPQGVAQEPSAPHGRSEMRASPSAVGGEPHNDAGELLAPHGRSELRGSQRGASRLQGPTTDNRRELQGSYYATYSPHGPQIPHGWERGELHSNDPRYSLAEFAAERFPSPFELEATEAAGRAAFQAPPVQQPRQQHEVREARTDDVTNLFA